MTHDEELRLLDDIAQSTKDRLNHAVYAEMLKRVLLSNRPGISVGLFGKWGYGKSTIIKLLDKAVKDDMTVVVFDAWKTSGDSVRKQMLLSIMEKIDKAEASRYKKTIGVPEIEELLKRKESASKAGFWQGLAQFLKQSWSDRQLRRIQLAIFSGFIVLLGLMALIAWKLPRLLDFANAVISVLAVGIIVVGVGFLWRKYLTVIGVAEPVSESHILKYPEHFRDVFTRLLKRFCVDGKKRLVVVVDDLDRCDANTIVEALSAVRQFADQTAILGAEETAKPGPGCQFLIPCDERQVVLALELAGHDARNRKSEFHDYQSEELLRKFFDVVIRTEEILEADLSGYAGTLAPDIGLDAREARELVAIAAARDPRQVKQLLNSLRVSHASIDFRCSANLLPKREQMPLLNQTEMLLVALRETTPEAFEEIKVNPEYVRGFPSDKSTESGAEKAAHRRANLIIERAGGASPVTTNMLIFGKLAPELRPVPTAGLLVNAFSRGDPEHFAEILSEVKTEFRSDVQKWLLRKAKSTKTDAGLRQLLALLLTYSLQPPALIKSPF
jgi:energy-coupling factor transporter ATP-binding protein EcfA2